ncbi:MAG: PQQ-binding-like beta-propeller repeat protein [Verrucomicrobia bacterium]|nr:PQQ-binding-like beta-propeller repeat protein [Verrucomicrobiota bacterium]
MNFPATPLLLLALAAPLTAESNWPQFRGPDGLAVATDRSETPTEFGPDKNVVWKTPLASGHSSPVLWGGKIFLTTFEKGKLSAVCLDRASGRQLWSRDVPAEKIEEVHRISSPAASTPCTDGERVYFSFGSFGLLALDFDGKEIWRLPLPLPVNDFGTGASPILAGGKVILLRDQDVGSFLMALDARTGRQVWRTERPGFYRGHSTPFLWRHDGAEEIVVTGAVQLKSYDPATGEELWSTTGLSRVPNATATAGDGLLIASSWNIGADATGRMELPPFAGFAKANDKNGDGKLSLEEFPKGDLRSRFTQLDADKDGFVTRAEWDAYAPIIQRAENSLFAVRPGGRGDITATHVAWKKARGLPYVPSPVYYGGRVFTVKSGGMASCFDAKTGRELWLEERVGIFGDFYASPVAAGGKIYFAAQKGTVAVVAAGDAFNVLAKVEMGEPIFATPAIADGKIYLRTAGHLYCFGSEVKP